MGKRTLLTTSKVLDNKVTVINLDDGKVNSFSFEMIKKIDEAFETAIRDKSKAIILTGNEKAFSAGFDLKIMGSGDKNLAADLVLAGARFGVKVLESKIPIIAACSGHAMAMGGVTLLSCDYRFGINNPKIKIGLNEVAINMDMPLMMLETAYMKMCPSVLDANLMFGKIMSPSEATGPNGYLDEVIDATSKEDFLNQVYEKTEVLLKGIKQPAFGLIKTSLRRERLKFIKETLEEDINKYR